MIIEGRRRALKRYLLPVEIPRSAHPPPESALGVLSGQRGWATHERGCGSVNAVCSIDYHDPSMVKAVCGFDYDGLLMLMKIIPTGYMNGLARGRLVGGVLGDSTPTNCKGQVNSYKQIIAHQLM